MKKKEKKAVFTLILFFIFVYTIGDSRVLNSFSQAIVAIVAIISLYVALKKFVFKTRRKVLCYIEKKDKKIILRVLNTSSASVIVHLLIYYYVKKSGDEYIFNEKRKHIGEHLKRGEETKIALKDKDFVLFQFDTLLYDNWKGEMIVKEVDDHYFTLEDVESDHQIPLQKIFEAFIEKKWFGSSNITEEELNEHSAKEIIEKKIKKL